MASKCGSLTTTRPRCHQLQPQQDTRWELGTNSTSPSSKARELWMPNRSAEAISWKPLLWHEQIGGWRRLWYTLACRGGEQDKVQIWSHASHKSINPISYAYDKIHMLCCGKRPPHHHLTSTYATWLIVYLHVIYILTNIHAYNKQSQMLHRSW